MKSAEESDRAIRVVLLLQTVADADSPITANEISERAGLPKATVYRLCDQLLTAGLIRRQLGGRGYVPGQKAVNLAQSVLASQAVYASRHAILARIAREIGETCNIVAPSGVEMIYWDRVETEWPLRLQLPIGTRVPFHATASGKMYLACLPAPQCRRLLQEVDLQAYTDSTLVKEELLIQEIHTIRERDYSLDDEEFVAGMTAIAVPIRDKLGRYIASLAVHAPKSRMSTADACAHVNLLHSAAERIGMNIPERETTNNQQMAGALDN